MIETFDDSGKTPAVRGSLHRPAKATGNGLVLTHGAGSDSNAPLLVALAHAFAELGLTVLRCDLPYRQQRPHGPPRGNGTEDRAGLRQAIEAVKKLVSGRTFVGGQSYGGRQASMLVAEEPGLADGLLILSYPLHPPGKPAQLRTAHLSKIRVPSLFVSGTKDPFGSPEELKSALPMVPTYSLLLIEGAGHDLGYGRRISAKMQDVPMRIVHEFSKLAIMK